MTSTIPENLDTVKTALTAAATKWEHPTPTLVAVSKGQPGKKVETALKAGHRVFGENRVQEAEGKWGDLRPEFSDIELHLIGPLQTNKVKNAVALFDVIQTLDRPKLAKALAKEFERSGKTPGLFIQVNTGAEPQKAGILPEDLEGFYKECQGLGLTIMGLMCIPPVGEQPAMHFALLKKLAGELDLDQLSMGMSGDFEIAAGLGATHVRVGTAIFGPRG